MSYFNPKFYCKQNLETSDRCELQYWFDTFMNLIDNTLVDPEYFDDTESNTLSKILQEVRESFCDTLKDNLRVEMQDNLISIIENYIENGTEDIDEVEDPETFLDEEEDEGDDPEEATSKLYYYWEGDSAAEMEDLDI